MTSRELKPELLGKALAYAEHYRLPVDEAHPSALIFQNLADNFHPESFPCIQERKEWRERTGKAHPKREGIKEMQSSNSSDALLMSIFCHPHLVRWKGVRDLLGEAPEGPVFGFPARIRLADGRTDATEIDLALPGLLAEAKLTEPDFTSQTAEIVEKYADFIRVFHVEALPRSGERYDNYQVIRNLLAAVQHDKRHLLLCDERRPDLARRYLGTVACLRDIRDRKRCGVVFWQELAQASGQDLRGWLQEKYGIC